MNATIIRTASSKSLTNGMQSIIMLIALVITLPDIASGAAMPSLGGNDNDPVLRQELASVRKATLQYRDVSVAEADGYVDINLFVSGQGWHYVKFSLIDGTFNPEEPEILVYAPTRSGELRLVAVEYAVPDTFPEPTGFTSDADVWEVNQEFHLWVLHAWVWQANPNGMFSHTNPNVP